MFIVECSPNPQPHPTHTFSSPAYDDGRTQLLLCVHGLLPMLFRGTTYNIPIAVWITHDYPRAPPIAYVVPTQNMLVKPTKFVEVSGRCNVDYLQAWERKSEVCTLRILVASPLQLASQRGAIYLCCSKRCKATSLANHLSMPNPNRLARVQSPSPVHRLPFPRLLVLPRFIHPHHILRLRYLGMSIVHRYHRNQSHLQRPLYPTQLQSLPPVSLHKYAAHSLIMCLTTVLVISPIGHRLGLLVQTRNPHSTSTLQFISPRASAYMVETLSDRPRHSQ